MTKIKILPPHIANKIAAGEVVERPASVVKELVENSLDAGATHIVVEIDNGGLDRICVTDNGEGMSAEDARLSFTPHATSKVYEEKDLYEIASLGFRGEAVASISSVSLITLKTKRAQDSVGFLIENTGGTIDREEHCATADGTLFDVRNLFFNTPARKKYMKTIGTEFGHIAGLLTQIALGFYGTGFKLIHNGQVHFDLPQKQTLQDRIYSLLGSEIHDALIPLSVEGPDISLDGFLVSPSVTRSSRKYHHVFVNQRAIQSTAISKAVMDAYHSLMPSGRYPLFIFNITINPLEVDVNIHPRKLEVKFLHQSSIYSFVKDACKRALESHNLSPKISFDHVRTANRPQYRPQSESRPVVNHSFSFSANSFSSPARDIQAPTASAAIRPSTIAIPTQQLETQLDPVAQIDNSYIIAHDAEGIVIIDQHAAHERINYMKLMDAFHEQLDGGLHAQTLVTPHTLELSLQQAAALQENTDTFEKLGFEVEHFGGNTYLLRSIPSCLMKTHITDVFISVLDDLITDDVSHEVERRREHLINYIACRSSIKFGQKLDHSEQKRLIADLESLSQKYTCPHGRPTLMRLTYSELEKKFGRS